MARLTLLSVGFPYTDGESPDVLPRTRPTALYSASPKTRNYLGLQRIVIVTRIHKGVCIWVQIAVRCSSIHRGSDRTNPGAGVKLTANIRHRSLLGYCQKRYGRFHSNPRPHTVLPSFHYVQLPPESFQIQLLRRP